MYEDRSHGAPRGNGSVYCWSTTFSGFAVRWKIMELQLFSLSNNYYTVLSSEFALNLLDIVTHILVFWRKNKNRDIPVTIP